VVQNAGTAVTRRSKIGVRHRFVSDLTAELSELAFVARNEARVVDLACNQAANAGYL
jgi:hypothetical protein